ncbi:hypothetical protein [Clostridium butyricum]|uniref:hypothetical protein n=1 Tax=Clostridium butyricum TaxID=1492 RepID=UPI002ABD5343|nr:hypothetical protein [Clostridium butyricum]
MISKDLIPKIEKILGFKLYKQQVEYLINDNYVFVKHNRRCGFTLAYMIKLALSEGEPIRKRDLFYTKKYDDEIYDSFYHDWFRRTFINLWEDLKLQGFKVREIK